MAGTGTSWYDDPQTWAAIAAIAKSATTKKGDIRFKEQPETAAELAYRKYAERLAGMNGTPGPTMAYLGPQIADNLQRISANSAAYQPLERLDVATGRPIARAPVATPPPFDFSTLGAPSAAGTPFGLPAPPPGAQSAIGGTRTTPIMNRDFVSDTPGGPGPATMPENDPSRNVGIPGLITSTNPTLGGTTPPTGMSRGTISAPDMAAARSFVSQYGKPALEIVFAIFSANPILGIKGAIDAYHAWKAGGPAPPGVGASRPGGGV